MRETLYCVSRTVSFSGLSAFCMKCNKHNLRIVEKARDVLVSSQTAADDHFRRSAGIAAFGERLRSDPFQRAANQGETNRPPVYMPRKHQIIIQQSRFMKRIRIMVKQNVVETAFCNRKAARQLTAVRERIAVNQARKT